MRITPPQRPAPLVSKAVVLRANTAATTGPAPKTWTRPLKGEWTQNDSGHASDPVNLYLHGSLDQLTRTFQRAGWTKLDAPSTGNNVKYGIAAVAYEAEKGVLGVWNWLTGRHDKPSNGLTNEVNEQPATAQTLDGRPTAIAFGKDTDPLGGRHHLRIFDTGTVDAQGQKVWAVAASHDTAIEFAPNHPESLFFHHVVDPNADHERDLVLRDLRQAGAVKSAEAFTTAWDNYGKGHLHSEDKRIHDVVLR